MTSSTGTPSRRPSSSARSGVMPFGWPVTASVCASTELPRLIAARSFPVGARSFSTSGDTAPPALWAKAETVAARSMEAAERSICMAFLPSAGPIDAAGVTPRRTLRTENAIRLLYASREQRTARHGGSQRWLTVTGNVHTSARLQGVLSPNPWPRRGAMTDLSKLKLGLKGSAELVVGQQHTAPRVGSGRVHVLATPVMINLMEAAALDAIENLLPPRQQSLGTLLNV